MKEEKSNIAGKPRVSIGLPVYNGERYLELALRSITAQTFRDFELLVLDDGSADRSRSIASRFAPLCPRSRPERTRVLLKYYVASVLPSSRSFDPHSLSNYGTL